MSTTGGTERGPASLDCDLPLGRPGPIAHNELVVSGRATAPAGIAGVVVQIGDRHWNASYGLDTPVPPSRPSDPDAGRAGYLLRIDTSGWEPGVHLLTVAAFDKEGERSAIERTVEIRPFGMPSAATGAELASLAAGEIAMRIEAPRIDRDRCEIVGALEVSGWAHAGGGVEAVLVTLDGRTQHDALFPVARPDLLAECGPEVAAGAGFALRLDPAECPPGHHTLSVVALGRDGRAAGFEGNLRCRAQTEPEEVATPRVAWLEDGADPQQRGDGERRAAADERDAEILMWEDRALLAEADAALSRAEAGFAQRSQEDTVGAVRRLERDALAANGLREELAAAAKGLAECRARADGQAREMRDLTARIEEYERSLSWRVTRPLRWVRRKLRRRAAA